jgi:hypothetical protein
MHLQSNEQADWLDCRISAYPLLSELSSFVGVNLEIAPNIVMIDLDRETYRTRRTLEFALTKTLRTINCFHSDCQPTVIWSGNGYHIYQVLDAIVLEGENAFNNNRFGTNPSQKFLRFAEWFLSNGKCDPQHNKTVSLRNCMLRIPGSINSKNGQTVKVIQRWNGSRPSIKLFLEDFYVYLCEHRLAELKEKRNRDLRHKSRRIGINDSILWIEHLLQTPIPDYRKLAIWRVLVPYLLNIRHLSSDQVYDIVKRWLDGCSQLRRLDFNPNYRIKNALNCSKYFLPISRDKLKLENESFYDLLQEKGVLS